MIGSAFDKPSRLELSQRGPGFSLALRERAGVGKALQKLKVAHDRRGDDEKKQIVNPPLNRFGPLVERPSHE